MDENQSKTAARGDGQAPRAPLSPARKAILIAIAAVLVLSVGARVVLSGRAEAQPATTAGSAQAQGSSFLPGQPGGEGAAAMEEPGAIETALPYVTEGSFFALLGFAVGYASKKFMKLGLLVLALFFVGLQVLSYSGVVSIDWPRAVDLLDKFVLNLKENQTVTEVLKDRLPSGGAFMAALFLGFRRG